MKVDTLKKVRDLAVTSLEASYKAAELYNRGPVYFDSEDDAAKKLEEFLSVRDSIESSSAELGSLLPKVIESIELASCELPEISDYVSLKRDPDMGRPEWEEIKIRALTAHEMSSKITQLIREELTLALIKIQRVCKNDSLKFEAVVFF